MTDTPIAPAADRGMAELAREWFAARIVLVAGFVVAIAFASYWTYTHRPVIDAFGNVDQSQTDQSAMQGQIGSGQASQAGFQLCRLGISLAETYGILPNSMKFAGGPEKTDVQGRYACAADDAANVRFKVTVDLVCKDLNNPNCVSLFNISKADGKSVFQRNDAPPDTGAAPAPDASAPADNTAPPADGSAAPPSDGGTIDGSSGTPPGGTP